MEAYDKSANVYDTTPQMILRTFTRESDTCYHLTNAEFETYQKLHLEELSIFYGTITCAIIWMGLFVLCVLSWRFLSSRWFGYLWKVSLAFVVACIVYFQVWTWKNQREKKIWRENLQTPPIYKTHN